MLMLVEYYTPQGNDIRFAWVTANSANEAADKLKARRDADFEEIITCTEQYEIVPLCLGRGSKQPLVIN